MREGLRDREASLLELDRIVIKRFAIDSLPMGQPVPEQRVEDWRSWWHELALALTSVHVSASTKQQRAEGVLNPIPM